MEKEIDVIIEAGLQKIVQDKINEAVGYINFHECAKDIIRERFTAEIDSFDFKPILKQIKLKDFDIKDRYGENLLDKGINKGLEKGISNILGEKFDIYWYNQDPSGNYIKDNILSSRWVSRKFIRKMKDFLKTIL